MANIQDIVWPAERHLKCQDPQKVRKYNDYLLQALEKEQMVQQIEQLNQKDNTLSPKDSQEAWESIHQRSTKTNVEAERQCHKLHAGKVPWTLVLTQAIYKILY